MMAEPKPLASLTSGLLARKGGARPAMRRQLAIGLDAAGQDDLGWNDMGYDVGAAHHDGVHIDHHAGLTPMPEANGSADVRAMPGVDAEEAVAEASEPAVVEQRRRVQALAVTPPPTPAAAAPVTRRRRASPRAEAGANGRFAFTLRLDAQRHLMLRLASAATNRSAQNILIALVDDYFANQPAVAAMAAQVGSTHAQGEDA